MNTQRFIRHLEHEEDDAWLRYIGILGKVRNTNTNELRKEVVRLHQNRGSRTLMLKSHINAEHLMRAHLEDMAYRSRLVEINIVVSKMFRRLEVTLGAITNHLVSNYSAYLKETTVHRTKGDINTFVEALLEDGWAEHGALESTLDVCKQIIDDIDKGGWSLRNMVELLKIVAARESVIKSAEI